MHCQEVNRIINTCISDMTICDRIPLNLPTFADLMVGVSSNPERSRMSHINNYTHKPGDEVSSTSCLRTAHYHTHAQK